MRVFLLALALLAAPAATLADPPAADSPEASYPMGAPRGDYPFVSWCYGALRGYLDLHDQVMPEVTRIETTWRRPGSNLAEDLKVYGDMQREGQKNLKLFAHAMTAAEKASMRPINAEGAEAVRKGRSIWAAASNVSKARVAQEWMSWTLPAQCEPTAQNLEKLALLGGAALQANAPADTAPAPEAAPAPAQPDPGAPSTGSIDDVLGAPSPEVAPDVAAAPDQAPAQP